MKAISVNLKKLSFFIFLSSGFMRAAEQYSATSQYGPGLVNIGGGMIVKVTPNMNWVPDEVNYANYHYVGTHNAHVYERYFKTTRQHDTDISDQLRNGVRGLAIDIYRWNEAEMNPTLIKTNRAV